MISSTNLTNRQSLLVISSFIFILAGSLFVYWPGLSGIFLVDDYPNLAPLGNNGGVTNLDTFLAFVFGNDSGPTGRPVSMLSFLLNDQHWPSSPESFKYTNLMIHALCGMLIILLSYRLTLAIKINNNYAIFVALLTGAFWILHPFNVSTTLYVIQRMAQLSTLFSLAGILCYCYGRVIFKNNRNKSLLLMSSGVAVFGLLSVFSKENGILMVLFILIIESTLFHNLDKPKELKYWFWIFVYAPLAILFFYFASKGFYVDGFHKREFTQIERLLTENRILIDYLHSILIPNLRGNGLINDDIEISTGLFTPITTILAIAVNLVLVGTAIRYRKRYPVFAFSILWFYGGHLLESTLPPLELYFEHRNYIPMIGPIFGVMYYLTVLVERIEKKSIKRLVVTIPVVLIVFTGLLTHQSAIIWSNPAALFSVWAYEHPNSLRAQRIYGQYLGINNEPEKALKVLHTTYDKFPHDISLPLEIINIGCRFNLETNYSLNNIEMLVKNSTFTDGVLPIAKSLVDNIVNGNCTNYTLKDAISFMSFAEKIPDMDKHKNAYAQLLFLHSDLYVLNKQLNPAIELLDHAFKYQSTPTVPIRQAELLTSAELYQDALNYINIAKEADKKRRPLMPSILPQLLSLERNILQIKNNNISN